MSGTQTSQPPGGSGTRDFGATVKDFIATRPRRPRHGRKIAGVAAGIANRYAIDPVIVRVALAVTALFGGAGVLAYLLGWLLFGEESDEVSPFESLIGRGRSATSAPFTVLLCLALIPASSWFFGATWFAGGGFSGFLGAAGLLGGLYLLHQNRGHLARPEPAGWAPAEWPQPSFADPATTPAGTTSTGGAMYSMPGAPVPGPAPSEMTGWDPLGAAPLAWDLPDPVSPSPPPEPAPRKPRVAMVTIGLALVVGALTFWITAMNDSRGANPVLVVGSMLGVIGLGLLVGAFVRSGRGLVWPAAGLAVVGLLIAGSGFDGWHGAGDREYQPTTVTDVQETYQTTAGSVYLDLRRLSDTEESVNTTVRNTFGDVRVLLPPDADVRATCTAEMGDVTCLNDGQDGVGSELTVNDDGPDGPGGLKVDLTAATTAGTVQVQRG